MPSARFRFAPSPNGRLHLGHAYSALLNEQMARQAGGALLLRIEDTDQTRCKPEFTHACIADLHWLGIAFAPNPRIQSEHFEDYDAALRKLWELDAIYPCFCSRKQVAGHARSGHDPDGQPHYGGTCAGLSREVAESKMAAAEQHGWRLRTAGTDAASWGDVMIAKRHVGSCYHIAVVVDDALQGITHVVRGQDLQAATPIHLLLQDLLGLPHPAYHHHALVQDGAGRKLAKSAGDTSLAELRAEGFTPARIRAQLGF
ncbi:MAG: tRNA glutamyl-Q(34) synthetase GluQRS [Alphaproteobacteria bacterium]|nr:tRNA glutamyl-Q(34) synthetase GluQRS [Alphaproteobacteria bacterium]